MAKNVLTEDELVAAIQRTSLITILVEGPDDLIIYNHIEERIGNFKYSFLPCGGRSTLLQVYGRRSEFNDKKVIFIADQDVWIFSGIPAIYIDCIFTSGYSIENDLYDYGFEALNKLLLDKEVSGVEEIIGNLLPWYCAEIQTYLNGGTAGISCHLNQIIPPESSEPPLSITGKYSNTTVDQALMDDIKSSNYRKLRGKFIFHAISRFLNSSTRRSKYSYGNILEISLIPENQHFNRIVSEIKSKYT